MTGRMENLHALLGVVFRQSAPPDLSLEFVIDTGFTGELTLPAVAVTAMELPFVYRQTVTLADDTDVKIPVHQATIMWQRAERFVHVLATGNRPLLGTALLAGCEMLAQFAENVLVMVEGI